MIAEPFLTWFSQEWLLPYSCFRPGISSFSQELISFHGKYVLKLQSGHRGCLLLWGGGGVLYIHLFLWRGRKYTTFVLKFKHIGLVFDSSNSKPHEFHLKPYICIFICSYNILTPTLTIYTHTHAYTHTHTQVCMRVSTHTINAFSWR